MDLLLLQSPPSSGSTPGKGRNSSEVLCRIQKLHWKPPRIFQSIFHHPDPTSSSPVTHHETPTLFSAPWSCWSPFSLWVPRGGESLTCKSRFSSLLRIEQLSSAVSLLFLQHPLSPCAQRGAMGVWGCSRDTWIAKPWIDPLQSRIKDLQRSMANIPIPSSSTARPQHIPLEQAF